MKSVPAYKKLLDRVSSRTRWQHAVYRGVFGLGVASFAGLAYVLTQRLAGILPEAPIWIWPALGAIAAIAGAGSALYPLPSSEFVARLTDSGTHSNDLFLTALSTDQVAGGGSDFVPLVSSEANQRAQTLHPHLISPWKAPKGLIPFLVFSLLLAISLWQLPQFDPFGIKRGQVRQEEKRQLLKQLNDKTELKAAQLAALNTPEAAKPKENALKELVKALQDARPKENLKDLQKLNEVQKELGRQWQQANQEHISDALKSSSAQNFGAESDLAKQIKDAVAKQDSQAIKQAIEKVQSQLSDAQKAASQGSPSAADKLRSARESLRQLQDALSQSLGSQSLDETLSRAMQQLDAGSNSESKQLSQEATQGAQNSLNLSKEQIEQMLKSIKDQQSLEDAMKALQQAKELARQGKLDGSGAGAGSPTDLKEYAKKFEEIMKDRGQGNGPGEGQGTEPGNGSGQPGNGPGMGQRGIGQGGKAPQDNTVQTKFQKERSPSMLQAGKILMEWSQKGQGETTSSPKAFEEAVREIKAGASAATLKENVPSAYHDAIQKYFDNIK